MSKKNEENSLLKFFRINFIGRPVELKKLVYDISTLVENENEIRNIVKAHNLYYGHKNIGNISGILMLTFFATTPSIKININYKLAISLIPIASFHLFSYFVYWHLIKENIIAIRKRTRNIDSKEKNIMTLNLSKDNHQNIIKQIGLINSLNETFNHYLEKK